MRVIAAEAGVSTGFVMHYFPEKQHLLDAVLEHNNAMAAGRALRTRRRRRGVDGAAALIESILPLDAERRLEWQVWSAYWTHARPGDGTAATLGVARDLATDLLVTCLREAVEDGEVRADIDLRYEAERLLVLAGGLGLFSGAPSTPSSVRKLANRMVADHMAALGAPVPAP